VTNVAGGLEPEVADPVNILFGDTPPDTRRLDPKMRGRRGQDRDRMPQPDPFPGEIVRPILHAVSVRACIMIDEDNIHIATHSWFGIRSAFSFQLPEVGADG